MNAAMTSAGRAPVLPLLALAYVGGVTAGALLGGPWTLTLCVSVAASLVAVLIGWSRPGHLVLAVAVILLTTWGHQRIETLDAQPLPALVAMTGTHEVVGTVRALPLLSGMSQRVDIDVTTLDGDPFNGGVRAWLSAEHGTVSAGDVLRFTDALSEPASVEAFDYAAFLRDRDIYLVAGSVREWERIGQEGSGWLGRLRAYHGEVVSRIEQAMPEPAAALAAGMLVGEQSSLPPEIDNALRVTGTTHLVVVSGQNVALLLGIAVSLLTAFVARRAASLIALVLLPAYVVFVGADPPVVRAAIMATAVVAAAVTGRRTPSWIYLTYAASLMLTLEPRLIRDVSFQLSAMATAGIITLSPALRDAALARFPALGTPGRTAALSVTTTATGAALAVAPVQVGAFGVIAPWTIVANVIVAPFYEATVAVAAIATVVGGTAIDEAFAPVLSMPPRAFLWIIENLARLPATEVPVRLPLAAGIVFAAVLVVATAALSRWATGIAERQAAPTLEPGAHTGIAITAGLAVIASGLWWTALTPPEDHASVTVLDVGQGLAVLARDRDATLLIDTGPPDSAVLTALGRSGVSGRLDAVVLTHADADHAGALPELLRRLDIGAVYVEASTVEEYAEPVLPIDIGDHIAVGRITAEVLAPPVATRDHRLASSNEASLVLMLTIGDRQVLIPGDIEAAAETWLTRTGVALNADVLVVPHHGSRTSSSQPFIEAVRPAVAVIPVGRNPYGHPHEEVLERYAADSEITVYRTDEDGSVTFRSDGTRLWASVGR